MRISFAIDNEVIVHRLISEAGRLRCDPRQLGAALLTMALRDGLVDSVLDGDDPCRIARARRRRRVTLEDRLDEVMLTITMAIRNRPDGRAALGVRDIARAIGTKHGVASRAARMLVDAGLLRAARGGHRGKTVYSLPAGEAH